MWFTELKSERNACVLSRKRYTVGGDVKRVSLKLIMRDRKPGKARESASRSARDHGLVSCLVAAESI